MSFYGKNVHEIPKIDVFHDSNLSFTSKVNWGLAHDHDIDMNNPQSISFCPIRSKTKYNTKSARAATMKKYFH